MYLNYTALQLGRGELPLYITTLVLLGWYLPHLTNGTDYSYHIKVVAGTF